MELDLSGLGTQAMLLILTLLGFALTSFFMQQKKPQPASAKAVPKAPRGPLATPLKAPTEALAAPHAEEDRPAVAVAPPKAAKAKGKNKAAKGSVEAQPADHSTADAVASSASAAEARPASVPPEGVATSSSQAPLIHHPGGDFNGSHFVDLTAAPHSYSDLIGGALSISFVARWDALHSWSRVVDFGSGSQSDNLIIANMEKGNTLCADVYRGSARKRLVISSVINIGETHEYLLTISAAGAMKMYQDDTVVGELSKGYAPRPVQRTHLYVGKSNSGSDGLFQGCISDLKVWGSVVDWKAAFPEGRKAIPQRAAQLPAATGSNASPPKEDQEEDAPGADENSCEASERAAKLKAKKAARKAKKAAEGKEGESHEDELALAAEKVAAAAREAKAQEAAEKEAAAAVEREAAAKKEAAADAEAAEKEASAQRAAKERQRKQDDKAAERDAVAQNLDSLAAACAEPDPGEGRRERPSDKRKKDNAAAKKASGKADSSKASSWQRSGGSCWADVKCDEAEGEGDAEAESPEAKSEPAAEQEAAPAEAAAAVEAEPQAEPSPVADGFELATPSRKGAKDKAKQKEAPAASLEEMVALPRSPPATERQLEPEEMVALAHENGFEKAAPTRKAAKAMRAEKKERADAAAEASAEAFFGEKARPVTTAPVAVAAPPAALAHAPAVASTAGTSAGSGAAAGAGVKGSHITVESLFRNTRDAEAASLKTAAAASSATGAESAAPKASREGPPPTALEKELLKLEKKAREIARLQEQLDAGEKLEPNQLVKISHGEALREKIAEMQPQLAAEKAEAERAMQELPIPAPPASYGLDRPACSTPEPEYSSGQGRAINRMPLRQWAKDARRATPYVGGGPGQPQSQDVWMEPLANVHPQHAVMMSPTGDQDSAQFVSVFGGAAFPGPDPNGGGPMFFPGMAPLDPAAGDGEERWECCWEWVKTGWCPRGETCRWEHPPLETGGFPEDGMQLQQFWAGDEVPPGAILVSSPGMPMVSSPAGTPMHMMEMHPNMAMPMMAMPIPVDANGNMLPDGNMMPDGIMLSDGNISPQHENMLPQDGGGHEADFAQDMPEGIRTPESRHPSM